MALILKIRKKAHLLVVVVSLGLLFFIVRELLGANPLAANKTPIVGVIAGKKITLREFQTQVDNLQRNFLLKHEQAPSEEEIPFLRKQAWNQFVSDIVYTKICKDLGMQVTEDELVDMVQGDHIHPDLQAAFPNPEKPETKEFSKKHLLAYLQNLSQLPAAQQAQWYNVEKNLINIRLQVKLDQLMKQSVFVTSLEAQHKFMTNSTSLELQYLYIPYHSIQDEQFTITDSMLKAYLQKHTNDYQVEETKNIRYVTFPILATENDKIAFQKELETLKQDFVATQEDSLFASIHTEANPNLVYFQCTEQDLPATLMQQKSTLQKNMVIGPLADGKRYKIYKITDLRLQKPRQYGITVIEKSLTPSDETKEKIFKKVDEFVNKTNNIVQFDAKIAQDTLQVHTADVDKHATFIGNLTKPRELVHWLYNVAHIGNVSPIFELGDNYVVAVLLAHTKEGTASLKKVQDKIKRKVLDEHKAKIITEKLQPIANLPLDTLAAQYGNEAKIFTAQSVKFNTNDLPGLGLATKTISEAFALPVGTRSKIIPDLAGIVLVDVIQRQTPDLPDSWQPSQAEQVQLEQLKQFYQLPKALEKLAHAQDYRYKYY